MYMENQRQEKIARLLQKELGDLFLTFARDNQGTIITVSEVRVSSDLSIARVYLSIFPDKKADEMITFIQDEAKSFRYNLGRKVKNQLRIIPQLFFHKDESIDKLERIDELLSMDESLKTDKA